MQLDDAERALLSGRGRLPAAICAAARSAFEAQLGVGRPFGPHGRAWWAVTLRARAVQRSHATLLRRAGLRVTLGDPTPGRQDEWHRR
ncbi:MAG: hypothetical protein M3065_13070 [Actinomycetota bacterium]|nr:hypothetical protein [Actinomycetota bacterium]